MTGINGGRSVFRPWRALAWLGLLGLLLPAVSASPNSARIAGSVRAMGEPAQQPAISKVQEAAPTSLSEALLDLRSSDADRRQAARSWLIEGLRPGDGEALLPFAASPHLASRRALADILATHPRHFSLAVELAVRSDPQVAEVGAWALEQSALRWKAALAEPPGSPGQFPSAWRAGGARTWRLSVGSRREHLPWDLERLDRLAGGPARLVLEPEGFPGRILPGERGGRAVRASQGDWQAVLRQLARAYRQEFTVWSWRPNPDPYAETPGQTRGAWVLIERARRNERPGEPGQRRTGAQRLAAWMQQAAQTEDRTLARSAAQTLAQVGWPDALAWFDQSCAAGRTEYWPALCMAAGHGRVSRSLMTQAGLARLLEGWLPDQQGSGSLRSAQHWSWHLARRALQRVPDRIEAQVPLSQPLLNALRAVEGRPATVQERMLGLVLAALADRQTTDPQVQELAWRVLGDASRSVACRRLALAVAAQSTAAASGSPALPPAVRTVSLDWWPGLAPDSRRSALEQADRAGLIPVDMLALSRAVPEDSLRLALWAWSLREDWPDGSLIWFRVLEDHQVSPSDPDGHRALQRALLAGRGSQIDEMLRAWSLRTSRHGEQATRYRLALGWLDRGAQSAWLTERYERDPRTAQDWIDIALCAGSATEGARARGILVGALGQDVPGEVLEPALLEALRRVHRTRDTLVIEEFEGSLQRAALRADHALGSRMLDEDWQAQARPARREPIELGAEEIPLPW